MFKGTGSCMSRSEPGNLHLNPRFKCEILSVGCENEPLIVIDELVENPDALIDWALSESKVAPAGGLYPGLRSPAPCRYSVILRDQLDGIIREIFSMEASEITHVESAFSIVATPFEDLRIPQRIPHFDKPTKSEIAVLHYLCDSPHGGTSFYRHKSTGFEFVDKSREGEYYARLKQDLHQFGLPYPPSYICGSTNIFEQIQSVNCRFNRALIYRCSSLHSGDISSDYAFDLNPRTGRFTVASFLRS